MPTCPDHRQSLQSDPPSNTASNPGSKRCAIMRVIAHMKADEDTGKELEIQQLTPRADWKTCEHRRPPDGKRGARLWLPGGCPCDQNQDTQPGCDDLDSDGVAGGQNHAGGQTRDFEWRTRVLRPRVKRTVLPAGQKRRLSTEPPRGTLATTTNRPRRPRPEPPDGYNRSPDPCAINTPTGAETP